MRTHQQLLNYRELELITAQPSKRRQTRLAVWSAFKNVWNYLLVTLTAGEEPRIWQSTNREGQVRWHVYDPISNQTAHFPSEHDVRVWLDDYISGQHRSSNYDWMTHKSSRLVDSRPEGWMK